MPAVFSHTGQIHESIKRVITEQIRYKLILLEGEAKQSKIKSAIKWWSKCVSLVAFNAGKMSEAVFETQADFVTCLRWQDKLFLQSTSLRLRVPVLIVRFYT